MVVHLGHLAQWMQIKTPLLDHLSAKSPLIIVIPQIIWMVGKLCVRKPLTTCSSFHLEIHRAVFDCVVRKRNWILPFELNVDSRNAELTIEPSPLTSQFVFQTPFPVVGNYSHVDNTHISTYRKNSIVNKQICVSFLVIKVTLCRIR